MKTQDEITYLKELITDKKDQIKFNENCINKGETPAFYMKWNAEIELEIESFNVNLERKQATIKS